jgi:hypothetical protein
MNQNITVGLQIQSNTAKETTQAERLGAALKSAADSAQRIKVPSSGVSSVMAKSQPVGAQAVMEYGQQRGSAGQTGAAARDFAAQSQGLGGLVRLYATYAANIYAAGAAFRALSDAMDTANMVKGLNQLGAASGMALGSLSKQLAQTTGNAISMREAMEATAKSTAAGLSAQNVLRLGAAATKASQALGVDISDAVSRLSRGITKLEPELLDELGIFVKIDDATSKYAQTVGKTASSLTDFEKRQAFANAVLDQAEKKFGSIKIDANPFNKLLASVKDLSQNILELVNKALGPLVNLLSASPTALLGIVGMLGTSLIKRALPAIGEFRKGLEQTAEASKLAATARAAEAVAAQQSINKQIIELEAEAADARVDAVNSAERRILNLRTNGLNNAKSIYKLLEQTQDIKKISDTRFERTEKVISGRESQGKITKEEADAAREAISTLKSAKQAALEFEETGPRLRQNLEDQKKGWGTLGQTIRISEAAYRKATSDMIVSNAANAGSQLGVITGFKLMQAQMKDEKVTGLSKAFTYLKGSMALAGGAAATFLGVLGPILELINLVVTAAGLLYGALTNTAEESKATADALTSFGDAAKNVDATLENISKKTALEQFNPQSVTAKANAVAGLSDSLRKVFETARNELKAMSGLDVAIDIVKMLWGGDVQSKLTNTISTGIAKAFKAVDKNSAAGKSAADSIKKLLGTTDVNLNSVESIQKALDGLSNKDKAAAIDGITKAIQDMGRASQASAAKVSETVEGFTKVAEARRKAELEFVPKDSFSEYGLALLDTFYKLDRALQDPEQKLNGIITLSKELGKLPVPRELVVSLEGVAKQAEELQYVTGELQSIDTEIERLQNLTKGKDIVIGVKSKQIEGKTPKEIADDIKTLQDRKASLGDVRINLITSIQSEQQKIDQAAMKVYETGSEVISTRLAAEWAKAGATVTTAIASLLDGTRTGVKMRADAERAVIRAQIAQIKSQQALILATEESTIARERGTIAEQELALALLGQNTEGFEATKKAELNARQEQVDKYKGGKKVITGGKDYAGGVEKMASMSQEATTFRLQMESSSAQIAQLGAQLTSIDIRELSEDTKIVFETRKRQLLDEQKRLETQQKIYTTSKELNSELSKAGLIQKQTLENEVLDLGFKTQQFDLNLKIKLAEEALARTKDGSRKRQITGEIELFKSEKERLLSNQKLEVSSKKLADIRDRITQDAKIETQAENDRYAAESKSFTTRTQALDNESKLLEYKKAAGNLAEKDYLLQKNVLDNSQINLTREKEIAAAKREQNLALIEQDAAQKRLDEDKKVRQERERQEIRDRQAAGDFKGSMAPVVQESTQVEVEAQKLINEQRARINASYATTFVLANGVADASTKNLEQQLNLALYQEAWNTELAKSQGLADTLANSFGKVGTAIGGGIMAIKNLNKSQLDYNSKIKEQKTLSEDAFALAEGYDQLGYTELATKEREKGNKALERGSELEADRRKDEMTGNAKALGSLKTMFKEKSAGYKAIGAIEKAMHIATLAMNAQKMISDGISMVSSIGSSMAKAGAAGLEAVVKAYTLPPPMGFIAGAAMAAIIGGLLGKAFGGGNKKPGNFVPTAAQRQETQGTAMGWDKSQEYGSEGKQVQVREGVFGDRSAKSGSIANSLEVIKNNSVAGLSYNDSMLKAMQELNKTMANAAKVIAGTRGISAGSGFGVKEGSTKTKGFLGIGGKETATKIIDSGVQLQGTFLELAQKGGGVIKQFETIETTTKKKGFLGFGGGTRIDVASKFKDLDPKAAESINFAFSEGYNTIMTAAAESGIKELTPARVNEILGGVKVDELASLRGLKGEELQNELNAVIGSVLDDAAGATFEQFKQFREFGEGMFETAVRVIDTNKKVKQVLSNLSGAVQTVNFEVSENMVKMAGGLEAFIEQSESFSENFLTEEERLAPKKKAVRDELERLGLSWVTTRKQFKDVVQSLIDSGAAGSETYADLMKLNSGFAEITPEVENLSKSLEELKNDLKSAAEQRINDLKSARDGFEQFSKSIRDYQQSLKTGALSPLTPGEKYIENKRQFEQLSALAKTDTKEGADARSKLQGAASALLESSRTMYSSSDVYTQDFGSVQAALDSAAQYGDEQVKKANESIELVKQQVQGLVDLKDSVDRLPEPISAGVGTAVMAALAGVNSTTNPVEAVKAAEAAKAERDERAIGYAQDAAETLRKMLEETNSNVVDTERKRGFLGLGAKKTTTTTAEAAAPAAAPVESYAWYDSAAYSTAATGTNYLEKDQLIFAHKGERILPAADNKQLMKMMEAAQSGNGGDLYQEVCKLTKQVEVLTKVVADGANMNTEATERNTKELAKTFEEMSSAVAYADRLTNRTTVV